eukprot:ANDGO_06363.mRNA.1 WD40 repeat-containing protein
MTSRVISLTESARSTYCDLASVYPDFELELYLLNLIALSSLRVASRDEDPRAAAQYLFVATTGNTIRVLVRPSAVCAHFEHRCVMEVPNAVQIHQIRTGFLLQGNAEQVLVAVCEPDIIAIYYMDREGFETRPPLVIHESPAPWSVDISPGLCAIAVGSNAHTVRVVSLGSNPGNVDESKRMVHGNNVPYVSFSPCGRFIATASIDAGFRIFQISDIGESSHIERRISHFVPVLRLRRKWSEWCWSVKWLEKKFACQHCSVAQFWDAFHVVSSTDWYPRYLIGAVMPVSVRNRPAPPSYMNEESDGALISRHLSDSLSESSFSDHEAGSNVEHEEGQEESEGEGEVHPVRTSYSDPAESRLEFHRMFEELSGLIKHFGERIPGKYMEVYNDWTAMSFPDLVETTSVGGVNRMIDSMDEVLKGIYENLRSQDNLHLSESPPNTETWKTALSQYIMLGGSKQHCILFDPLDGAVTFRMMGERSLLDNWHAARISFCEVSQFSVAISCMTTPYAFVFRFCKLPGDRQYVLMPFKAARFPSSVRNVPICSGLWLNEIVLPDDTGDAPVRLLELTILLISGRMLTYRFSPFANADVLNGESASSTFASLSALQLDVSSVYAAML